MKPSFPRVAGYKRGSDTTESDIMEVKGVITLSEFGGCLSATFDRHDIWEVRVYL